MTATLPVLRLTERRLATQYPDIRWVYALGSDEGYVKIGHTLILGQRIEAIQACCPLRLRIIWKSYGGPALERDLHGVLADRRIHGEWFDFRGSDPLVHIAAAIHRLVGTGTEWRWGRT